MPSITSSALPRFKTLAVLVLLAACAQPPRAPLPGDGQYPLARLPATFVNAPSCEGCLEVTVTLRPDGTYQVRERLGTAEFYDFGRWRESRAEGVLRLEGGRDAARRYVVRPPDMLEGQDGAKGGNLRRGGAAENLRGPFRLVGLYTDGKFKECRSGLSWPVAPSRAAEVLEGEYLKARQSPGQQLLASVDARFEEQESGKARQREMLVVLRLPVILGGERCPAN